MARRWALQWTTPGQMAVFFLLLLPLFVIGVVKQLTEG
jgi:hypothetical protein